MTVYISLDQFLNIPNLNSTVSEYINRLASNRKSIPLGYLSKLNTFLSKTYSTSISAGNVDSFKDKFKLLWIPGTFDQITVPLIGDNLTNTGFISSDFNGGLNGKAGASLLSGVTLSDLSLDDMHIGFIMEPGEVSSKETLLGAIAASGEKIEISRDEDDTLSIQLGGNTPQIETANSTASILCLANATAFNDVAYYEDIVEIESSNVTRGDVNSLNRIRLFAGNSATNQAVDHTMNSSCSMISIGEALNIQEISIFREALAELMA